MKVTPRVAITLTFIAFGIMAGAQMGAIPTLIRQAGVDALTFGMLIGLGTAATIAAMSLGGFVNRHFDHRSVLLFTMPVALVNLLANLMAQSVLAFAITYIIFSICLGTLDLFMNAEASHVEHTARKPVFASFHAAVLYAIGLSGLAAGYIAVNYGSRWAAIMAVPFLIPALIAVHRTIAPHRPEVAQHSTRPQLPRKLLALIGIIVGLDIACELACIQWSGQLLADMQPSLAAYSGLGMAFYGLCSGTVRLMGDWLRTRFRDMTLVMISLCVGVLGFGILALKPNFAISVAAFAIAGGGLGLIFPCLFSVAASLAPNARASALGFVSAVSGPPRIFLPVLLGALAQSYGLSAIYVASVAGCVAAITFVIWTMREMKNAAPLARSGTQSA